MARTGRPPQDTGPPGLGSTVPEDFHIRHRFPERGSNGENSMPQPEIPPSDRVDHIPWSGRGAASESPLNQMRQDQPLPSDLGNPDSPENRLETLWNEFVDQNAVIEQLTGQLRSFEQKAGQFWTACDEQRTAIISLQQRLDALARQQVFTNTRIAAAQLAVQAKGPHDKTDTIRDSAEIFYQFLMRDLVASVPPSPSDIAIDPKGSKTQH